MEKNITYEDIHLSEVTPDNIYEQPEWITEAQKTEVSAVHLRNKQKNEVVQNKKRRYHFNIFITIFAVITLILTLVCLIFVFIYNQPHNSQENIVNETQIDDRELWLAIEKLKFKLSNSTQEIQFQASILQDSQNQIQDLKQQLNYSNNEILNMIRGYTLFPRSCKYLTRDSPSGYYHIETSNGLQHVYCDTNRTSCSCNTTGGWMRVANLDMTDPTQQCPDGFKLVTRTEPPLRTCGRPDGFVGCVSATFPVHDIEYSRVCGRIVGYQVGSLDAFRFYTQGIDGYYLCGISLTHGQSPRQHIWSFAGAVAEGFSGDANLCPCIKNSGTFAGVLPPFVGSDYFCDTAIRGSNFIEGFLYPADPLWDGQGCGGTSTCCEFNNPPWFCKQLPQPTTDDIELRICDAEQNSNDDAPFEVVEILIN